MNKITVVCHKDHEQGYEDYVGKCLLCEIERVRLAAEMALKQLQRDDVYLGHRSKTRADAIQALRQALAESANSTTDFVEPKTPVQQEQEAFTLDRGCWERGCCAYDTRDGDGVIVYVDAVNISQERVDETAKREHDHLRDATKKVEREWVGLTDEEYDELMLSGDWGGSLIQSTQNKLKEKNT